MSDNSTLAIEKAKRVARKKRLNLFLGAGFSIGGKDCEDRDLLFGKTLVKSIVERVLELNPEDSYYEELISVSLKDICSYVVAEKGEKRLTDYLCSLFRGTSPSPTHKMIKGLNIAKIYTTNIDDIVENIYGFGKLVVQNETTKNTNRLNGKIEYLKLHGDVNNPSAGLIFTSDEYITSMKTSTDYRFISLMHDIYSESIFFIGTSFNEINIDYFLSVYNDSGYDSYKGELFFVNPFPNLIFESKIRKVGGHVLKMTAEDFFNAILNEDRIKHDDNKINQVIQSQRIKSYETEKNSLDENPVKYRSELYEGAQPNVKDIFFDWDFIHPELLREINQYIINYDSDESYIITLVGKALTGKSTYLYRIGYQYYKLGYAVFIAQSKFFNYFDFLVNVIKNKDIEEKRITLILDDSSFFYKSFSRLIRAANEFGVQLVIIASSRPIKHSIKYKFFQDVAHEIVHLHEVNTITSEFAKEILDKLELHGLEGDLMKFRSLEEKIEQLQKDGDIVRILYKLFRGNELTNRLNTELNNIFDKDKDAVELFEVLCLFEHLELPSFPLELGVQLFGSKKTRRLSKLLANILKEPEIGSIALRTRHRVRGTLNKLMNEDKDRLQRIVINILKAINKKVSFYESNYWTDIHSTFNKYKFLSKYLKLSYEEVIFIYDSIRHEYKNNHNYWLQLGIAEQSNKFYDKAFNHLKQAQSIPGQENSYMIITCIGGNFIKKAIDTPTYSKAKHDFSRGESELLGLINRNDNHISKSFASHSLLSNKIKFLEIHSKRVTEDEAKEMVSLLKNIVYEDRNDDMSITLAKKFQSFLYYQGFSKLLPRYIKFAISNHRKSYYTKKAIDDIEDLFT